MRFKNITIPAEGRNKYGNYMSSSEVQKSVVRVTYNGNNTTGGNDIKKQKKNRRMFIRYFFQSLQSNLIARNFLRVMLPKI